MPRPASRCIILGAVRRLVLGAVALVGCSGDTVELALDLTNVDCVAADFAEIDVVSIEVYGQHDGDLCALARRCMFDVDVPPGTLVDVDALSDVLAAANQPLVDTELEGALYLRLVGRRQSTGCWSPDPVQHPACAQADLADAEGDTLALGLNCAECPNDEVPLCP